MLGLIPALLLLGSFSSRDTSIRLTDWRQLLTTDTVEYKVAVVGAGIEAFYVSPMRLGEGDITAGYPELDYMTFGDLDGDQVEEAVMQFSTGGSAGSCSYAVFAKSKDRVITVHQGGGYRMGVRIEKDTLKVYQPYPTGYDPNCCAQSLITTSFRLYNGALKLTDSIAFGVVHFADRAVERFYKLIKQKDYLYAYDLLSEQFQRRNPYEEWLAGYQHTVSTDADIGRMIESDTVVPVQITSVDIGNDKQPVHYAGAWKLIWSGLDDGWLLHEPKIRKVK